MRRFSAFLNSYPAMELTGLNLHRTLLPLFIMCFLYHCIAAKRNLTLHLNPYCEEYDVCNDLKNDLVYVEAVGSDDALHYLWSTQGVPSFLIVQTYLNATLNVNWTNRLSNSTGDFITFSEDPIYSFGTLFSQLWQYNDTSDTAVLSDAAEGFDFSEAEWMPIVNNTLETSSECSVTFSSDHNRSSGFLSEGTFSIKLSSFGFDGRSDNLPRLLHTSDSFEIGVILDKLLIRSESSRFALEFMVMYDAKNGSKQIMKSQNTSLDDEYTPGVFTAIELATSAASDNQQHRGYYSWKPVAYRDTDSSITQSTDVKLYKITKNASLPFSIVKAYFRDHEDTQTTSWNISFGMSKDHWYNKTQYTSWYLTVGLGLPIEDSPSLLLMLTIGIGFGAPFLCMVAAGAYMCFKRFLRKEDDLLLSRDSM